jgi:hypothetical protein
MRTKHRMSKWIDVTMLGWETQFGPEPSRGWHALCVAQGTFQQRFIKTCPTKETIPLRGGRRMPIPLTHAPATPTI